MAKGKAVEFLIHMKSEGGFQSNVLDDSENLWVVDVYTEWCGYCTCASNTFHKLRIQYNDAPIKFGTAASDHIPFLSRYLGTCQPTFLWLSANGTLLDVVRGINVPLIVSKTQKYLEKELKIKKGELKRELFVDEAVVTPVPVAEEAAPEAKEEEEEEQKITVALIKPDAVASGKVEQILGKLDEVGIEVLLKVERTLTREEAEQFYEEHGGTDFFLQLIDYITSGPIVALALVAKDKSKDVVEQWRLLIGPKDVTIAKEEAPESLRAQFACGDDPFKNALHGSDTTDTAARELAFFFPTFHQKKRAGKSEPVRLQRTLALIRPDALRKYRDEIMDKIHSAGFEIANAKEVSLTKEQAAKFYKEHEDQEYFDKLVTHMSSGPVMALALCREDAVSGWRTMLGPKNVEEAKDTAPDSLRAQFIEDSDDPALNALHGSDSLESAEREVNFFFPKQQTLAVIKPDASAEDRELIVNKIRSSGFHIAAQKETVLTKELVAQFYAEHVGKEFFGELTDLMTSGPTMFMLLSREDAISGMREIVGPADPEEAKKTAPESIRAVVGKSKLQNAIHAPSDEKKAREAILLAFGDELEFDEDGSAIEKTVPDDGEIEGAAHAGSAEAVTDAKEEPAPQVTGVTSGDAADSTVEEAMEDEEDVIKEPPEKETAEVESTEPTPAVDPAVDPNPAEASPMDDPAAEPEQTVESAPPPDPVSDNQSAETSEQAEKTSEQAERTSEQGEKTSEQGEKTSEQGEKTTEQAEKTSEQAEKTSEQAEKTSEQAEKTSEQAEKTSEQAEKTSEQAEKTSEQAEKTSEQAEKTSEQAEKTSEQAEKTPEQAESAPAVEEPTPDLKEVPETNAVKTSENEDPINKEGEAQAQ